MDMLSLRRDFFKVLEQLEPDTLAKSLVVQIVSRMSMVQATTTPEPR